MREKQLSVLAWMAVVPPLIILAASSAGNPVASFATNGGIVTGSTVMQTGQWYHIVGVYNTTGNAIYVNGAFDNSVTYSGSNIQNNQVSFGATCNYGANGDFNGTIDEVRIYNRTLSASEIQSLYNATKARLDYADVRFTDSDGATLLPFWMESDGKFWVKVPSIPTTGTTIYAYYGNPAATDAQNGTGTFLFFDDFSTTKSGYSSSGSWSISDGVLNGNGGSWPYYILAHHRIL